MNFAHAAAGKNIKGVMGSKIETQLSVIGYQQN
jgi:hypothetical protein